MRGRVIRRYKHNIPFEDFEEWQNLIRTKARGCGLYALYAKQKLLYVGLATKSIRARVKDHCKKGRILFTHFSVFLVTGRSSKAQAQRIRDLEALLLNIIKPMPSGNHRCTKFVGARELKLPA